MSAGAPLPPQGAVARSRLAPARPPRSVDHVTSCQIDGGSYFSCGSASAEDPHGISIILLCPSDLFQAGEGGGANIEGGKTYQDLEGRRHLHPTPTPGLQILPAKFLLLCVMFASRCLSSRSAIKHVQRPTSPLSWGAICATHRRKRWPPFSSR